MVTDSSSRGAVVKTGDIVEGRYRIIETLGQGAMGAVFLAEHVLLRRRFALKLLRADLADDDALLEGFLAEARAAGTLGHPHIVECSDLGVTRGKLGYLALEYLEGAVLTDEIYRVGGLPVRRALNIADQIASALEAAHGAGIVHRGLTSDAVFLVDRLARPPVDGNVASTGDDAHGVVKVLDFGVARFHEAQGEHARGAGSGSPEFMAPEQLAARGPVDHRVDVYALGVILYEMLTARRPFSDDDKRALRYRVVNEPPPPLMRREAPRGLEELILGKLLAKDPAQRCASMQEVRSALEAFAAPLRPGGPVVIESEVRRPHGPIGRLGPESPAFVTGPDEDLTEVVRPAARHARPAGQALPARRSPRVALVVAAVLAGAGGAGLGYLAQQTAAANTTAASEALADDAERLGNLLDSEARAAHLRAGGVATMPMLRAAIETDAATLKDMVGSDFIYAPKPGEVLELFQLHDGAPVSILRIPDGAPRVAPVDGDRTRIESDGRRLTVVVGAQVTRQNGGAGGSVAISVQIDLAPIARRLAGHARAATLIGLGAPVPLLAAARGGGSSITVAIPRGPELGSGGTGSMSLAAVLAPAAAAVHDKLQIAQLACWGVGGALLVLYLASLLRGRKRG